MAAVVLPTSPGGLARKHPPNPYDRVILPQCTTSGCRKLKTALCSEPHQLCWSLPSCRGSLPRRRCRRSPPRRRRRRRRCHPLSSSCRSTTATKLGPPTSGRWSGDAGVQSNVCLVCMALFGNWHCSGRTALKIEVGFVLINAQLNLFEGPIDKQSCFRISTNGTNQQKLSFNS